MFNKLNSRRGQRGFTLIELLIVVAIIGIIAAILIPNLLDALQKAKQKRTMGDIRNIGTAWFSWFQDQVSAAAAGSSGTQTYDFGGIGSTVASTDLIKTLFISKTMFYIQKIPQKDGWGNNYEFRGSSDLAALQVMGIRSGGRDGSFSTSSYTMGPFIATKYEEDIVWADGFFVRYPAGAQVVE